MPSITTIARILEGGDAKASCAPCATFGTAYGEIDEGCEMALTQARQELLETADRPGSA
jgi:hypothetical protein